MTGLLTRNSDEFLKSRASGLPLLRWAGGKQRVAKRLAAFVSSQLKGRIYVEPFLGAGSVFFELRPEKAILSDISLNLISCYESVARNPADVSRKLTSLMQMDSVDFYYQVRDEYNSGSHSNTQAARLLYLNRTCFNGIFRVNKLGDFNVPYGHKNSPTFPSKDDLVLASEILSTAEVFHGCFRDSLSELPSNSVVFLDPPYPATSGTAFFQHYTSDRFIDDDQEDLADMLNILDSRGVKFVMTNADINEIHCLYRHYSIAPLSVTRHVSCKAEKMKTDELLIWNF